MNVPKITIFHDLVWFGGIESSELDLLKKLHYAGYNTSFAHREQYFTKWNSIGKLAHYGKIYNVVTEEIKSDIIIYSSLIFPNSEFAHNLIAKKRIAWIHFIPTKKQGYYLLSDENFTNTIDVFVCVSNTVKRELLKMVPNANAVVIHNSLDIDKVDIMKKEKVDIEKDDDTLIFVTVGRIAEEKRIHKCFQMARMLDRHNVKYKWYIVGGGHFGDYDKEIARMCRHYPNVIMTGYQDNPYKYMVQADYCVLFTKKESWGIFIDESWYLGIPTITTDFETLRERPNYQDYGIVCNQSLNNLRVTEILEKKDILKKNLKNYVFKNEYDKWQKLFARLLSKEE